MIETYVLADPDSGVIKYVGRTTKGVAARLKSHLSEAGDAQAPDRFAAGDVCTWIRHLKHRRKQPIAVIVGQFDAEIAVYDACKRVGVKLLNQKRPHTFRGSHNT